MCVDISNKQFNKMENPNKKVSNSIKNLLKQLFKQHKSQKLDHLQNLEKAKNAESMETLESLENNRNTNIDSDSASLESHENDINERLSTNQSCEVEDFESCDVNTTVPVHFVRTEHGTFFWTDSSAIPADNDLAEPLSYSTYQQLACMQDRWAQA